MNYATLKTFIANVCIQHVNIEQYKYYLNIIYHIIYKNDLCYQHTFTLDKCMIPLGIWNLCEQC
jgi:hypothetical protein